MVWHKLQALMRLLRENGVGWTLVFIAHRMVISRFLSVFRAPAEREIGRWMSGLDQPVHIFTGGVDYAYPYRQRPQHIVVELARRDVPIAYVTPSSGYDRVYTTALSSPRLLLTPHRDAAVRAATAPIVHVLSTDAALDAAFVDLVRAQDGIIVYDYIDALDDAVSSGPLDRQRHALHDRLLADESRTVVMATASALLDDVAAVRSTGFSLVTNGVDPTPFRAAVRSDDVDARLATIVARGKPIVGYFGSFAAWFDYDLMNACARARPDYSFVLIGPDLDGTRDRLDLTLPNLSLLGGMSYRDLPRHAVWFDVCLVPFVINHITLATSPLKIFEYMSLGRPTVSTGLPECRKYQSVLTADGTAAFCQAIDQALGLSKDPEFVSLAYAEGEGNSWARKVDQLLTLVAERQDAKPSQATRLPPDDVRPTSIGQARADTPFATGTPATSR